MSQHPTQPEWLEQLDHERMKNWMLDHDWSIAVCANPADIVALMEEADDDTDSDCFETIIINI